MFGKNLSYLRRINNITQEELGIILGYSKNAISSWESGRTEPDFDTVSKIAKYFNTTTDYLLGFNQDDKDKIKRLELALKESGINDIDKAIAIIDIIKDKKE